MTSEQTKCALCGNIILATTAAKNNGMCRPCKKNPGRSSDTSPMAVLDSNPSQTDAFAGAIGSILLAVLFVGLGIGAFYYFQHLEAEGGNIRTHWLVVVAYRTFGPNGVLGLFLLGAFGWGCSALLKYRKYLKFKKEAE